MTDSNALRERIKQSGMKYRYVAERVGITPYALQRKIDNESEFKVSEVDVLADLLGLTLWEKDAIFFSKQLN